MARPIVTLTTDFGLSDYYSGAMKGVILGICPQAQIVDLSHEIRPYAISEGAHVIAEAYPCFPKKTVHVVVVDPGVGTARRPIIMEAAGQRFVAPDNGVLAMIYSRQKHKIRLISNDRYFRKPVSNTFHGRDIFAPVGAHIAAGEPVSRFGRLVDDYVRPEFERPRRAGDGIWTGRILNIDRFGNVITNFHASEFADLERRAFVLSLGSFEVRALARNYAESRPGELFAIIGGSGYLEVSVGQGSAAERIGCEAGAAVELRFV
jgi:S-adenosylmethionine hydrolase